MCKHTTTIFICGHQERDMLPTSPSCVFGNLHPHGPHAVFHVSKVARICGRCERGNDERAEKAGAELEERALTGAKQGAVAEGRGPVGKGQVAEDGSGSSRKKAFYWGR